MQIFYGFILAVIVAFLAYRTRSLSKSGALAATFVGTVIFGIGGWGWAILLLTFFITSSGLSRAFKKRKENLNEKFSKGHERDAGQVLGNGGMATLFVLIHALYPESMIGWVGFAASLAAVNADTWATELGVLNPTPPYLITNPGKRVEKGTSGGISLWGTGAALLGSAVIALPAALLDEQLGVVSPDHTGRTGRFALRLYFSAQRYKPCITVPPMTRKPKNIRCIPAAHRRCTCAAGAGWIMIGSISPVAAFGAILALIFI